MDNSLARLDLSEIFCDMDDFYQVLERLATRPPNYPAVGKKNNTVQN